MMITEEVRKHVISFMEKILAILAGDALLNYAYEVATKAFDLAEKDQIMNVVEAIKILASKPGIYGMIGGQVADVELEGTPA